MDHSDISQSTGTFSQPLISRSGEEQTSPPCTASLLMPRVRSICPSSHSLHGVHSCSSQSTVSWQDSSPQGLSSSSAVVSQGSPPQWAGLTRKRCRVEKPPPQVCEHSCHADQSETSHGTDGVSGSPHCPTSSRRPSQSLPPFSGKSRTFLLRKRCTAPSGQWLHSPHSSKAQSLFSKHLATHFFVDMAGPSQGGPHSLLWLWISRCRSQRPKHVGSCHSLHAPHTQGFGTHSSLHFSGPSPGRTPANMKLRPSCCPCSAVTSSAKVKSATPSNTNVTARAFCFAVNCIGRVGLS
mmetsp:Transcript_71531/g.152867  ORF Transcript_71531/g.152867 Transcript_71531/m.152867 type:complete len:295 (+) Transcript_71531:1819-2703(+)